tara:strand:- start:1370 stop:1735 length:366 start_codon:yes stop_codon:yes gene_type:complete
VIGAGRAAAGAIAAVAILAATYAAGQRAGEAAAESAAAREERLVREAREAMEQTAGTAISKIEVRHVTIRQQADTVIREVPVYSDCRHDPRVLRSINEARTGDPAAAAGAGSLPAAAAADR